MKHLKVAVLSICVVSLSACASNQTTNVAVSKTPVTTSSISVSSEATNLTQIKEINGLKIAFPAQWAISAARGGGPNANAEQVWEIASSAQAAANDEGGIGVMRCPMDTLDGYDNPNDIRERRTLTKGTTMYDLELNILNQRSEIEPWLTSILFSKKGANLQDKNNSCSITIHSDNAFTDVEKDLFRKIYQSIQ